MAAAASDLLTGWCLFGLALLVRDGSPALPRPLTHPLPFPEPAATPFRPLAVPVLGVPAGLLARAPESAPPRVLPCGSRGSLGGGAAGQSPERGAGLPCTSARRAALFVFPRGPVLLEQLFRKSDFCVVSITLVLSVQVKGLLYQLYV